MKKIHVLHVYKTSFPQTVGGVGVFMDSLCRSTSKLNVRNTVFSLTKEPSACPVDLPGYQVVQAKQDIYLASTGFSISAFSIFCKLAAEADIIHYCFPNPFADVLHFLCKIKKPTIITYQSDIIKQKNLLKLYYPLMRRFFRSANCLVATSPNYFSTSDVLQDFQSKTRVIPIGSDKENYPSLNKDRVNYWMSVLPKKFFLFIGAFRYYKGLHFALDAISQTNHQLVLAGIGDMEKSLKAQARKNHLNNAHFLGLISDEDKVALLHLCYAFVFPSHLRSEAFGISLLEAAMYGNALISSEIGTGTSFINIDQKTGLVIKPSSSVALRNAMDYLSENPYKTQEFRKNAEKRYQQYFTADKQAEAYLKIYQELLGGDSQ